MAFLNIFSLSFAELCSAVGSMSDSRAKGPWLDTQSGRILLFFFLLIQEGYLSVTWESMGI